ncbi:MAG: hypothetical protein ABSD31_06590 [Candidatus Binataceae bacterium]|jgi:hypothetical protein
MDESPPKQQSAAKPIRWPVYSYLFFDLCILAAVGAYAFFAWMQWNILSEQSAALRQNLADTRIAADAARQSADAARQSADAARQIAEAAEQSSRAERAVLIASARPYVTTDKVSLTSHLAAGAKVTGLIKFTNAGKSPALNFHAGGRFKVRDSLPGKLVASGQPPSLTDVLPGTSRVIETTSDDPITEDEMAALRSGEKSLYGYGIVVYEDGFGNQIAQSLCQVYNWKEKAFGDCPQPGAETSESKKTKP